ncbi:MAG: hypothetical protein P1P65_03230 [Treponema sp.]
MGKNRSAVFVIAAVCIVCFCISCTRNADLDSITFPPDSALKDADRYAVIIDTYISLKDSPGNGGITVSHARRKEIYEVRGTAFVSRNAGSELWVHLTGGWLLRSSVELYPSREKAETAAARLK